MTKVYMAGYNSDDTSAILGLYPTLELAESRIATAMKEMDIDPDYDNIAFFTEVVPVGSSGADTFIYLR